MLDADKEVVTVTETGPLGSALVLGGGQSGLIAAGALADLGIATTVVTTPASRRDLYCPDPECGPDAHCAGGPEDPRVEMRTVETLPDVRRDGIGFKARFSDGSENHFGCVFLTPAISLQPVPPGLPDGLEPVVPSLDCEEGGAICFLLDYGFPTDPAIGMTAMRQALHHASNGGESHVVFRNIPVRHPFGERLYDRAKQTGVRFYRFGERLPVVTSHPEPGKFQITVEDVIDPGEEVVLSCDRLLVGTRLDSDTVPQEWCELVGNERDRDGFLVPESIHCIAGRSFRDGVFAVGEGAGSADLLETLDRAAAAAVRARAWMMQAARMESSETVTVTEHCCRCLTCHRICPHTAISFRAGAGRSKIEASGALCHHCGVCVAECPRGVLDLVSLPDEAMVSFLEDMESRGASASVIVMGCKRSPGRATGGVHLPSEAVFFTVPCVGRVSEGMIWAALAAGVKGVLIVGCHHGNCASDVGTDLALVRVRHVLETLSIPDKVPPPVKYLTVAANEPARFLRVVTEFCASLEEIQPRAMQAE